MRDNWLELTAYAGLIVGIAWMHWPSALIIGSILVIVLTQVRR